MERTVDLNCDLGESFGRWRLGDDDAMFTVISSANVACGFHAGDPRTMISSCERALVAGVAVGAHVSYRDLAGFGRREILLDPDDLYADVLYQLSALSGIASTVGTRVSYVKPHGALYNRIAHDRVQADAVARAVADFDRSLPLMGLPASAIESAAKNVSLTFVSEAFVDRGYLANGSLAPRNQPGGVLLNDARIAERAVRMVERGEVEALDGSVVQLRVDSLCVHGDTPGAVGMARAVRASLAVSGIGIRSSI